MIKLCCREVRELNGEVESSVRGETPKNSF
jgi:hypothetical protein